MSDSPDETATHSNPAEVDELLPVLPKGDPLFDGIPTRAVVLEELAPALGDGALVVRRSTEVGVVLIRERNLFETYCFRPGERLYGRAALERMKGWDDAAVSAYRLEPELVDVCPSLLRGDLLYGDLRLSWTDWNQLLADLSARDGNFVVEVRTPKGRGVTCIANGKQIATFTEAHPELGPPSLLDALAAARSGSVWIHSEPAILDEEEWIAAQAAQTPAVPVTPVATAPPAAAPAAPAPPPTPAPEPEDEPAPPAAIPMPSTAAAHAGDDDDADEAVVDDAADIPNPFAQHVAGDDEAVETNPFAAVFGGGASAPTKQAGLTVTIAELLPDLKDIARNRLGRSAARVEAMLDDAAAGNKPLDAVLEDIRGLVIRGVMQSTLDEVADEMRNLAASHAA